MSERAIEVTVTAEHVAGVNCSRCGRFVGRGGLIEVERIDSSYDVAVVGGTCALCVPAEAAGRSARAHWSDVVSDEITHLDVSVVVPGLTEDDLDRAADVFHDADIDGSMGATLTTGEVWFAIPPGDGEAALAVLAAINELYGRGGTP